MDLDMTPTCIFLGCWILISTTVGFDTYEHLGLLLFWIWCLRVSFWIDTFEYLWWTWMWHLHVFWMDFLSLFDTYVYLSVLIRYLSISWMDFQIWYLQVSFWLDTYEYLWWGYNTYVYLEWIFNLISMNISWFIPTSILNLITRHEYLEIWIFLHLIPTSI